jgi:crotonobetainyl-CoA:carnitine CoA-transferase CaiB-like acyl-CoA transferase
MSGPMDGIRVLDLGAMIAGPAAATILADQGADVIKVEPAGVGDVMRYLGAMRNGVSSLFHNCNRGKRSLALNLKSEQGVELLKKLVRSADVVVENFRPGVTERLGIDFESLSAENPDIIYLSVSGFGDRGPLAGKSAYDNVIQTFAGVAQSQADQTTGEPVLYQQLFSDKVTALTGSQAISAALFARERGRGGQHIKLAMTDAVVSFLWADVAGADSFLEAGASEGMSVGKGLRLLVFKDGYGTASPVTDKQFHGYCRAFGIDASDPRLATIADRNANLDLIASVIKQVDQTARRMLISDAMLALEAEDVPCAAAMALNELPHHPQLQAMESFGEFDHPRGGAMREPNNAPNFQATPSGPLQAAPELGEHSDAILRSLGIGDDDIQQLRSASVIS